MTASTFWRDWVVLYTRVLADVISIFLGVYRSIVPNYTYFAINSQPSEWSNKKEDDMDWFKFSKTEVQRLGKF